MRDSEPWLERACVAMNLRVSADMKVDAAGI